MQNWQKYWDSMVTLWHSLTNIMDSNIKIAKTTLFLPYLCLKSLKLKNGITKHVRDNIPDYKFREIFSSKRRISNCLCFKDVIPKHLQSHFVYRIYWHSAICAITVKPNAILKWECTSTWVCHTKTKKPTTNGKTSMKDYCK